MELITKVVGKITDMEYLEKNLTNDKVTFYRIKDENGKVYGSALMGEQKSLKIGDKVEIDLKKFNVFFQFSWPIILNRIKNYRILE